MQTLERNHCVGVDGLWFVLQSLHPVLFCFFVYITNQRSANCQNRNGGYRQIFGSNSPSVIRQELRMFPNLLSLLVRYRTNLSPNPPDQVFDAIWYNKGTGSSMIVPINGKLIRSTAHLILRFARDAELDYPLAPHSSGLQNCLCARVLREFFSGNLRATRSEQTVNFYADANLITSWANLGRVGGTAIRNHILHSLISNPKLYDHQGDAIIILFELAGPTLEAYADPSVVDRCFKLLKGHYGHYPEGGFDPYSNKRGVVKVRAPLLRVRGSSG